MCGICGLLNLPPRRRGGAAATVQAMQQSLAHRGPDDAGVWNDDDNRVALGHRRLSIIDLSPAGHQPMISHDSRWVLSYNGEFYNFRELRAALERKGSTFRGNSDTEVFLEGVSTWGLMETLRRCRGMFALILWDRHQETLYLARDRFGKKPLYYVEHDGRIGAASEPKAFRHLFGGHLPDLDLALVPTFARFGFVPGESAMLEGVRRVPPGSVVAFDRTGRRTVERFWNFSMRYEEDGSRPSAELDQHWVNRLRATLLESVSLRMIADVPIGAFLSGGTDSSLVVSVMKEVASAPVRTYTVGFEDPDMDEAPFARKVAEHLGTDHHEEYISTTKALQMVERIPDVWDEPFADPSAIPTLLVCEMASRHVKVVLTGDGGDEMFGGYGFYRLGAQLWKLGQVLPRRWFRRPPGQPATSSLQQKARRVKMALGAKLPEDVMVSLRSVWLNPNYELGTPTEAPTARSPGPDSDPLGRMVSWDIANYLPDDILAKVDRASMAFGLETRAPLLDQEVARLAASMPSQMKIRGDQQKWILKRLLSERVPTSLTQRPKSGFGVPLARWLRGPLRDWADSLLDPPSVNETGLFDANVVAKKWRQHKSGKADWCYQLWNVLMVQQWLGRRGTNPPPSGTVDRESHGRPSHVVAPGRRSPPRP